MGRGNFLWFPMIHTFLDLSWEQALGGLEMVPTAHQK